VGTRKAATTHALGRPERADPAALRAPAGVGGAFIVQRFLSKEPRPAGVAFHVAVTLAIAIAIAGAHACKPLAPAVDAGGAGAPGFDAGDAAPPLTDAASAVSPALDATGPGSGPRVPNPDAVAPNDATCPSSRPCAIMPLGDSITFGVGSSTGAGYRLPLYDRALADDRAITFVGSMQSGPAMADGVPFPRANEGHSGYTIDDAPDLNRTGISRLTVPAIDRYAPDIVLLMIGTNDVATNNDVADAPNRLARLVDSITAHAPRAVVVVAEIVPTRIAEVNAGIEAYNAGVAAIVKARAAGGKHVALVDMYGAFTANTDFRTAYMADDLHPNDSGYDVMAGVWYHAIRPILRPAR
jgi:lysophospholipase L1-like esterase